MSSLSGSEGGEGAGKGEGSQGSGEGGNEGDGTISGHVISRDRVLLDMQTNRDVQRWIHAIIPHEALFQVVIQT